MDKNVVDRVIVVILDGVGVGELPDAAEYGDLGSNSLANTAKAVGGLSLPNFKKLGLGNIIDISGVPASKEPLAAYGKLAERSHGKDTTAGHWELMGLIVKKPFPVYPHGFPLRIIKEFENKIGTKVIGNKAASGTEIIRELGEEHLRTGYPIVYTSADSVFQIAAHKKIITLDSLYNMCRTARSILTSPDDVVRVIARPFNGEPGRFTRTKERKDFSLSPPGKTVLDYAKEAGTKVFTIGKTADIFNGRGIFESTRTIDNADGLNKTCQFLSSSKTGLVITGLTDFDMLWGHRNNVEGYAKGLSDVDKRIPELLDSMRPRDVLFFTADHGCDPTTSSTDHSREYIPVLVIGDAIQQGIDLGKRDSFSDVGKSIADLLSIKADIPGKSFAEEIMV